MTDLTTQTNPELDTIEPPAEWLSSRAGLASINGVWRETVFWIGRAMIWAICGRSIRDCASGTRSNDYFVLLRTVRESIWWIWIVCGITRDTQESRRRPGKAGILECVQTILPVVSVCVCCVFRPLSRELLVKQLNQEHPEAVVSFMYTMVMDSNNAKRREGEEPMGFITSASRSSGGNSFRSGSLKPTWSCNVILSAFFTFQKS